MLLRPLTGTHAHDLPKGRGQKEQALDGVPAGVCIIWRIAKAVHILAAQLTAQADGRRKERSSAGGGFRQKRRVPLSCRKDGGGALIGLAAQRGVFFLFRGQIEGLKRIVGILPIQARQQAAKRLVLLAKDEETAAFLRIGQKGKGGQIHAEAAVQAGVVAAPAVIAELQKARRIEVLHAFCLCKQAPKQPQTKDVLWRRLVQ